MQLGSGTLDLLPSFTWLHQFETTSYGVQLSGVIRAEGENDRGYRLGNALEALHWIGICPTEKTSFSAGLSYKYLGALKGTQEDIGTMGPAGRSITTAFNENHGHERLDALLGVNVLVFQGHRIAADIRFPLWQDLNGLQLEIDYTATLGWQYAW